MVVPFGWSVGDIKDAVKCLYSLAKAFRSAGGARERYTEEATFLEGFALTLTRLNEYITTAPDAKFTKDIQKHVELINGPCTRFHNFLQKYDAQLSSSGVKSSPKVVWKTMKWAVDDELRDKVNELRRAVFEAQLLVDTLLSLQILDDLANVSQKVAGLAASVDNTGVVTALNDVQVTVESLKQETIAMKAGADAQPQLVQDVQSALTLQAEAQSEVLKQSQAVETSKVIASVRDSESTIKASLASIEHQTSWLTDLDMKSKLEEQTAAIRAVQTSIAANTKITQRCHQVAERGAISRTQSQRPVTVPGGELMGRVGSVAGIAFGVVNLLALRQMSNAMSSKTDAGRPESDRACSLPTAPQTDYRQISDRQGSPDERDKASCKVSRSLETKLSGNEWPYDASRDRKGLNSLTVTDRTPRLREERTFSEALSRDPRQHGHDGRFNCNTEEERGVTREGDRMCFELVNPQHRDAPRRREANGYIIPPGNKRSYYRDDPSYARGARSAPSDYWCPREGIEREVIVTEICKILGMDASCRPGQDAGGLPGYWVRAYSPLTAAAVQELRERSAQWLGEKERRRSRRGEPIGSYADWVENERDTTRLNGPPENSYAAWVESERNQQRLPGRGDHSCAAWKDGAQQQYSTVGVDYYRPVERGGPEVAARRQEQPWYPGDMFLSSNTYPPRGAGYRENCTDRTGNSYNDRY